MNDQVTKNHKYLLAEVAKQWQDCKMDIYRKGQKRSGLKMDGILYPNFIYLNEIRNVIYTQYSAMAKVNGSYVKDSDYDDRTSYIYDDTPVVDEFTVHHQDPYSEDMKHSKYWRARQNFKPIRYKLVVFYFNTMQRIL